MTDKTRPVRRLGSPAFLFVLLLLVLISLPAGVHAGYREVYAPGADDALRAHIYKLDNGLTVYLTVNREEPRFYVETAIRAGSKFDPAESTGLAHYLEHMLFKGTTHVGTLDYEKEKPHLDRINELYEEHFQAADPERRRAIYAEINRETQASAQYAIPNEMDKLFKALGETGLNAHTSNEETVFKVGLPANRLQQWARLESERFVQPVFRLFQPELEIVYEEKNRSMDNKDVLIHEAVTRQLFKKHPYGQQTTIGEAEHLKNPSLKNLYAYYQDWYVPNNAAILLSGDIDPPATVRLIDQTFSRWAQRDLPKLSAWEEEPLEGVERVTVEYEGEEFVLLAFRLPGRQHPDIPALKLVDMILDNATAGLINLNLNQKQKVRQAGSFPNLLNDYSAQYFYGIPKQDQSLEEVEQLLIGELERVKRGEFEDWIIPAIVTDFKKQFKLQLESNEARVALMRDAFVANLDWTKALGEIERLERVTREDVIRVANRYYGANYVAGYRVDKQHEVLQMEKPAIDKIDIDATRQSEFARQLLAISAKPIEPVFVQPGKDYVKESVRDGIELYTSHNPINDLFVFTVGVEIGSHHDNRLSFAAQLLDKSGAGDRSAEDLQKDWYRLGSEANLAVGDNETLVTLVGLDERLDESLSLLVSWLKQPQAEPGTLDMLKQIILVQRRDAKKDHRAIAGALVEYNRYGAESRYLRALSNDALVATAEEELFDLIRGLLDYRLRISYTGSLPKTEFRRILDRHLQDGFGRKDPPPYRVLQVAEPEETRILFFDKEMAQSQIRLEFADGLYRESIIPQVQLFNDYFAGGMSGIVFQELREARALAYSAGAVYSTGSRPNEQNVMIGAIGCQADKSSEALAAFLELMNELPASADRFADTRASVLSRYRTGRVGFREVLSTVQAWERLGLSVDPREKRFQEVQQLDLSDVVNFHGQHLKGRPKLVSIVGDSSRMDLERLAQNGRVTRIDLEQLFAF